MFYAKLKKPIPESDNQYYIENNLYYSFDQYYRDTFSPEVDTIYFIEFKTCGKTYQEKKQSIVDIAIAFQAYQCEESDCDLSWADYSNVTYFFEKMAKRYGLAREFKENAII